MYSRGVAHHASSAAAARNSHLTGGNSPRFSPVNKLTGCMRAYINARGQAYTVGVVRLIPDTRSSQY
ncbi:hypothetical protein AC579_6215 [Pseudocercospora musae]|uniref:Uncharacterized protein n=1 Tax=Pseudocercospora musae TaxID=113226 RepID=A0A139IC87_9PEZI|nr:hypothetical protein AC579_6215 [Pseudocercospora musae]